MPDSRTTQQKIEDLAKDFSSPEESRSAIRNLLKKKQLSPKILDQFLDNWNNVKPAKKVKTEFPDKVCINLGFNIDDLQCHESNLYLGFSPRVCGEYCHEGCEFHKKIIVDISKDKIPTIK